MNIIDNLPLFGRFGFQLFRKGRLIWEVSVPNLVVNEGRNYILGSSLAAATQLPDFYIALFENNYTPVLADIAATFPGSANEFTDYVEATRQQWVPVVAAQIISNTASPAEFTFNNVAPTLVYGLSLHSVSGKGATTGTLVGAAKFATARTVENGDIGRATYGINAN